MTKIPHDEILEGLYKLRIRESEKLRTVLELYDLEIHQKWLGPDFHRLKTMVKRSIEQNLPMKNFGARNGNYEKNAVTPFYHQHWNLTQCLCQVPMLMIERGNPLSADSSRASSEILEWLQEFTEI